MKKVILNKDIFGYRAAIVENGLVEELFIEKIGEGQLNGVYFKGRVINVIPGIESAFIDINKEKNGFLHIENVKNFDPALKIGDQGVGIDKLVKTGEELIVQVLTDPSGNKGLRLTTNYTLPGKYLVLVPNSEKISISKKIEDSLERERLKNIIEEILPNGFGVIVRTEASEKTVFHFERELAYLLNCWKSIEEKFKKSKIGDILYIENNLCKNIARDIFGKAMDEIIINHEESYWEMINYINTFGDKNNLTKIKLVKGNEDIFEKYGINEVVEKSLKKLVPLQCGGYLVIETTEALTSVDVNTGRNLGNKDFEETIYTTNLEAAKEIPRQLRLRNIGGIIIIDFIDMKLEKNRESLIKELEINLKKDRVKNEIIHFTDLNLVEMTRKRVGTPLSAHFYEECPTCKGLGKIKSKEAQVEDILKELKEITRDSDFFQINLFLEEGLFIKIKENYFDFIKAFLEKKGIDLNIEKCTNNNIQKSYRIELIK